MSDFTEFSYLSQDGLRLAARIYGEASTDTMPVVCLPGLTRNARDFHELALYLAYEAAQRRKVVVFDYRGRGRSQYDPNWQNYNVVVEAGDVTTGLAELGIERAAFIGTSRGGLIVFVLAMAKPALLGAVVLNDIGPVIEGAGLAQIRGYLTRRPKLATFADAIAFQKQVNGSGFSGLSDSDIERYVRAFYREEAGGLVADFDPALVNTLDGLDFDAPMPTLWPQFEKLADIPLLTIRGANSSLLSGETLAGMQRQVPAMQIITVSGQAHAPLLETAGLPQEIAAFLDRS